MIHGINGDSNPVNHREPDGNEEDVPPAKLLTFTDTDAFLE